MNFFKIFFITLILIYSQTSFADQHESVEETTEQTTEQATEQETDQTVEQPSTCLLYTSPSPRDIMRSRMPSSA